MDSGATADCLGERAVAQKAVCDDFFDKDSFHTVPLED